MLAENTSEEASQKEKTFLDHFHEALKNPSAEHMMDHKLIYIGIGLFITVIIAIAAIICMKKIPREQVFDKNALYQDLDREGPFLQTQSGEILPESFVKLKRVIGKHAHKFFSKESNRL